MIRYKANTQTAIALIFFTLLIMISTACSSKQEKARKVVEDSLKSLGIRDMTVDLYHPADNMPDRAYIAVTITHNFATGDGSFQKEYLGYILKQDGQNWAIEKSTVYTKNPAQAELALAGRKK